MKIMAFTEGTLTMASCGKDVSREQRVEQVKERLPEINDFESYIPVDNAVNKVRSWSQQGADICYLTSRTGSKEIQLVSDTLDKFQFPKGTIYFRKDNESYCNVAERTMPDILIEDDCESIGGEVEMTYPHIDPTKKRVIKSIVVKEFQGIDHLPGNLGQLKNY